MTFHSKKYKNNYWRHKMTKTKVGIIGAGNISKAHIKAIIDEDDFEIVGITDISKEARDSSAETHGITAYADHKELMQQTRPDYVTVCTPHFSHGPITLDALQCGVNVFMEKPMTISAREAEECIREADSKGLQLGINYVRRQVPNHQKLKELLDSGFMGNLIHATMICAKRFRNMAYYKSSDWRATWKGEGGGVVVNQAPHDLDLLLWLLGKPESVVSSFTALCHDIEVEDDATALFKYSNGACCTFYASTNVIPGRESLEIIGTKGRLILENGTITATSLTVDDSVEKDSQTPAVKEEESIELKDDKTGLKKMHKGFRAALNGGYKFICPAEDGLLEVQTANAMLISAVGKKWVSIPGDIEEFEAVMNALVDTKNIEKAQNLILTAV
jgi:predicted dehydrogenase